jgi:hypothetical protein
MTDNFNLQFGCSAMQNISFDGTTNEVRLVRKLATNLDFVTFRLNPNTLRIDPGSLSNF